MVLAPFGMFANAIVAGTELPKTTAAPPFTRYCKLKAALQPAGLKLGADTFTVAAAQDPALVGAVTFAGAVIAQEPLGASATTAAQPACETDASLSKRNVKAPEALPAVARTTPGPALFGA
ncbi:MAG: hypothetical protein ACK5SQ_06715, partial [Chitinophagales bacterium]